MEEQLLLGFQADAPQVPAKQLGAPAGYKGLYRFHKYWGKKPYEPLAYIIEHLTQPGDVVLDPFVGSGPAGREALLRSRKFVGFDINPFAVELTRLLLHPPNHDKLAAAIQHIELQAREPILNTYLLEDGKTHATHYLWEQEKLKQVWVSGRGPKQKRRELEPTPHDRQLIESFLGYRSKFVRQPRFFQNSRINASPAMTLDDILTARAQRNLDLLIQAIETCPKEIAAPLKLCLTAASGQMTKMVFAVTGRGKTTGATATKIEVGSWVIGFWRPKLHFEVNVWNCFSTRTSALLRALKKGDPLRASRLADRMSELSDGDADAYIACGDCRRLLDTVPNESVQLIITDPPHSDRMPYLELSEFWNSILGVSSDFDQEIVISNAKERDKTSSAYAEAIAEFLTHVPRVLRPDGLLALLYNARQADEWRAFQPLCTSPSSGNQGLSYLGYFPCNYSAGSVVQDNRKGSLKSDMVLVFAKPESAASNGHFADILSRIPSWSSHLPQPLKT